MQAEAGEARIDGQGAVQFGAAVIEHVGHIGHRRRDAVAYRVHHHRAVVDEAGVEELQAERTIGRAERRLVGLEANVAIGVEIKFGERLGQLRRQGVEGSVGQVARALEHIVEAEMRDLRLKLDLGLRL